MALGHRWDKSKTTVWPLRCLECGCTGRVKQGTAGTMEYRAKAALSFWVPRMTCVARKKTS